MATTVRDVMTTDLATCPPSASLADAARVMRDRNIGDVLVMDGGELRGIVTDRDIVIRCVAEGVDSSSSRLEQACSSKLTTVDATATVKEAARVMSEQGLRRLPVLDHGAPVGIVTLGDLAIEREPNSALGRISAEPPTR